MWVSVVQRLTGLKLGFYNGGLSQYPFLLLLKGLGREGVVKEHSTHTRATYLLRLLVTGREWGVTGREWGKTGREWGVTGRKWGVTG